MLQLHFSFLKKKTNKQKNLTSLTVSELYRQQNYFKVTSATKQ